VTGSGDIGESARSASDATALYVREKPKVDVSIGHQAQALNAL